MKPYFHSLSIHSSLEPPLFRHSFYFPTFSSGRGTICIDQGCMLKTSEEPYLQRLVSKLSLQRDFFLSQFSSQSSSYQVEPSLRQSWSFLEQPSFQAPTFSRVSFEYDFMYTLTTTFLATSLVEVFLFGTTFLTATGFGLAVDFVTFLVFLVYLAVIR